jgi:MFS superfamily sulfate permease-like transporter
MKLTHWKSDLRSSLVVFLVALPLCLGIALASNAPLSAGLLAGIVGGLVVGSISGSQVSVSGPAAGLTVIVAAAISDAGTFGAFALSVFLSGIFQIIFSFFQGGNLGNYFPSSVIKGMLAAIGLILILKQLPHAIGYDADFMGDQAFFQFDGENTFSEILKAFQAVTPGAAIVALISLFIMIGWDKGSRSGKTIFQLIPGALIAVVISVVLNELFKAFSPDLIIESKHLVQLPFDGGFGEFFGAIRFPDWSAFQNVQTYVTALVIAIVGSIESLLSVEAADKIDEQGRVTSKNRELLAQGMGNAFSGLIGGLPLTAVIVRTSANITAGAKTKLSAILHGVWLLSCVIFIPNILNLIPLSCLAAVLLLVGYKLTKPELIKSVYKKGWNQFAPFVITVMAILFTDLLVGIMIGMLVGFFFVIRSGIHQSIVMVNDDNRYLIRFYKDVSFLQKSTLLKYFDQIPEGASLVIDGSRSVYVDEDITDLIDDYLRRARGYGIKVELKKSTLALSNYFKE